MRKLGKALLAKCGLITPLYIAGMEETVIANLCTCWCKANDPSGASDDASSASTSSNV